MTTATKVTHHKRHVFKKIISQLDRTNSEKKILKIVAQVQAFLDEHDIGWDAANLHLGSNYMLMSERARRKKLAATTGNGHDHEAVAKPAVILGGQGRDILKRAIVRHPDWETVRSTLDTEIGVLRVADLIAVAELLGIDPKFVKLFDNVKDEAPVTPPGNNEQK